MNSNYDLSKETLTVACDKQ